MKVEETNEYWIQLAKDIATKAHEGQRRCAGELYINHPKEVADSVEDRLKPIAWLHDVVEDTPVSLEDLKNLGFPNYIVEAVDLLTHRDAEPNIVYWKKILTNPDASIVKVADIKNNFGPTCSDRQKEKYTKALEIFKAAGYSA